MQRSKACLVALSLFALALVPALAAAATFGLEGFGSFSTYMAQVVELSMEGEQPRIHRIVGAMDCGQVINPAILEQQIKGGVVYGLANALRAKITIEKGRVVQGNFDDYAPLRMNEVPPVEAYFVESSEAPTGAGEPPIPPLAPANNVSPPPPWPNTPCPPPIG